MTSFRISFRPARALAACVALTAVAAPAASAQARLLNAWTGSTGIFFENWSLPTAIATTGVSGGTQLVSGASQLTVPFAAVVPLGSTWSLDAYSSYVMGQVRLATADAAGRSTYHLDGPTDTKVRLAGQLIPDVLTLSVGVTAPTGSTKLSSEQLNALNVLAAPALRFRSPFLGAGAGATVGLVLSQAVGSWGLAFGTSYEARGTYAPAEALTAGASTTDLRPGNAAHLTFAAERLIGSVRHLLSVAGDLYQAGELRSSGGTAGQSALQLGPSVSGTYQMDAAFGSWPVTAYAVGRHRSEYKLGGAALPGTGRTEVEGGLVGLRNLNSSTAVRLTVDGRVHSTGTVGTAGDVGFATAGVKAVGGMAAIRFGGSAAHLALEPFGRVQVGTMDFGTTTRTVTGLSGGATLTARF